MEKEGAFWEMGTEYARTWECLGTTRSLSSTVRGCSVGEKLGMGLVR